MKTKIDFEYLDKKLDNIPLEERRILEGKFTDFVIRLICSEEEDYCKKKGLERNRLTPEQRMKMGKAINQRKKVKQAGDIMMSFDPMLRKMFRDNKYNDALK